MDGKMFGALILAGIGLLMALQNRRIGPLLRAWNSGHLLSPTRASDNYRSTKRGRYPLLIVVGSVMAAIGLLVAVLRLLGPG